MKKFFTGVFALVLVLSLATTAFAETKNNVNAKMNGAVAYLTDGVTSYDVSTGRDYLQMLKTNADVSAYKDGYISSLKTALSTNGKLSSMIEYGTAIQILNILGYDATNFEGYNLVQLFQSTDPTDDSGNPYYYLEALESTTLYSFEQSFVNGLINGLISKYTMGSGLDYYGYSTDSNAYFVSALSFYSDEYSAYIEDALALIENGKNSGGYYYNSTYTDANVDSTGVVLMAYSYLGNVTKANEVYSLLCGFENASKVGVYDYYGAESYFGTKDALFGLVNYYPLCEDEKTDSTTTTEKAKETTTKKVKTTTSAEKDSSMTSPKTGANSYAVLTSFALLCSTAVIAKKRINKG